MQLTLYEFGPTRAGRVRWTLLELDMPFESIAGRELFHSPELKKVHPLGKLPGFVADGRPLFESAAIATWCADRKPEKGLAHKPGTWERALHDQWVSFALTELEAHLWSRLRNTMLLPEEKRVAAIVPQNEADYRTAIPVLDDALKGQEYLVGGAFSVTDIIVGFTANWGRNFGLNTGTPEVNRWLDGLYQRPHCTIKLMARAAA
ncbi:MAG: glutathione S-transferase family protein [Rhodomicrobium sp.]